MGAIALPFRLWKGYCLCICQLSSWSSATKYGGDSSDAAVRQTARNSVVTDEEDVGKVMLSRLEANAIPSSFKREISLYYQRKSTGFTHFNKRTGREVSALACPDQSTYAGAGSQCCNTSDRLYRSFDATPEMSSFVSTNCQAALQVTA